MPQLHNTVAKEIEDFHKGCHVQFRHQTEDGPRVAHGTLDSYSIGHVTVMMTLRYSKGEKGHFVVHPNTGVTFIVGNSTEKERAAGEDSSTC